MSEKRIPPLRWKLEKERYQADRHLLRQSGKTVAVVAKLRSGGWYSYGLDLPVGRSWNTASTPANSIEAAKSDAMSRARLALQGADHV